MKKISCSLIILILGAFLHSAPAQDSKRTIETKVADMLAGMPAMNEELLNSQMVNMLSLGESGWDLICRQIVAPGTGDDTRARYAITSLSRYLSQKADPQKSLWEKTCIKYVTLSADNDVRSYFIDQLALVGGDVTVEALAPSVKDKNIGRAVISALEAIRSEKAAGVIEGALGSADFLFASQAINALNRMEFVSDAPLFIRWYTTGDNAVKKAALEALAAGGSAEALPILENAARNASYKWEPVSAVSSLLLYARNIGMKGDTKKMDGILKTVTDNCKSAETVNYRITALTISTEVKHEKALPMLLKAINDPDVKMRGGVVRLAISLQGQDVTKKWMTQYKKSTAEAKADIIYILGERHDLLALPLVSQAMYDKNSSICSQAVAALAKLKKSDAVDPILSWSQSTTDEIALNNAADVLVTILDSGNIDKIASQLKQSKGYPSVIFINLLAWSKNNKYFETILPYTSSDDIAIRSTAMKALKNVASEGDQETLIKMVVNSSERPETEALQQALIMAANTNKIVEERSDIILQHLAKGESKEKLIPVLASTGGAKALAYVLNEFENGDAGTRDVCFGALSAWNDYSASEALYKICASENKTFSKPAFDAYIRQIESAPVTDDNKLLLYKKIAPYALYPDSRAEMIVNAGAIHSYPAFFFVSKYLYDADTNVVVRAAQALENIALPHEEGKPGLYGNLVRKGLEKAVEVITGPESEYDIAQIKKYLSSMPEGEGFVSIFNGKDLSGWQGLVGDPIARAKMSAKEMAVAQKKANEAMNANWSVRNGSILFNGEGNNLCTIKQYGDFEMFVDWKINKDGDSGIYLRGTPQVQIWDNARTDVGAQVGSGGLYNNKINRSTPLVVADNKIGEWNNFHIIFMGNKVTVYLNGKLVVDNVVFENYWDATKPIFDNGPIELQAHGTNLEFRDIYVKEINAKDYNLTEEEKGEGFVSLFNGRNLDGWVGDTVSYKVEDGNIVITPGNEFGGNLYTAGEYSDFDFRFEFQLTHGANNGLGIRTPLEGDAAYVGMELQILDNTDPIYADLQPYQYHGSVYGVIPARREFLNPVGEWNYEEVIAQGTHIKIILNGTTIVDGDIANARDNGTMDHRDHPGLKNTKGHIGFLGHGSIVKFCNIRIKPLN